MDSAGVVASDSYWLQGGTLWSNVALSITPDMPTKKALPSSP
jgi:hypothetical protein